MPYVVRSKKGAKGVYALVGERFISGLMAGQAMETNGAQSEMIRLE